MVYPHNKPAAAADEIILKLISSIWEYTGHQARAKGGGRGVQTEKSGFQPSTEDY